MKLMSKRGHTAIHEAGHVVAFCHFSNGIYAAHLAGADGAIVDRDGCTVHCLGLVEPRTSFDEATLRKDRDAAVYDAGIRNMVCSLAGPYAEARHRKISADAVALSYGTDDFNGADEIATHIEPDPKRCEHLHQRVERIVRKFLREPEVWCQIQAVADVLFRDGRIGGDHILLPRIDRRRDLDP